MRRWARGTAAATAIALLAPLMAAAPGHSVASAAPDLLARAWGVFTQAEGLATTFAQAQPNAAGAANQAYAAGFVNELAQFDLDNQLLRLDPAHPLLFRNPDPLAVAGPEQPNPSGIWNPDNVNYIAVITGAGTYELHGVRGTSVDLEFQAETGFPGDLSVAPATATFALPDLAVNSDGTYTLTIGGPPGPRNWLPPVPHTTLLSIRETFNDWSNAVPDQLTLVRTDQSAPPLMAPSTQQLAIALLAASIQLIIETVFWDRYWGVLLAHFAPNVVNPAAPTTSGLPNQISSLDHFHLQPGQALVITVAPDANAGYQGLEVADDWGQTLPYGLHQSTLNGTQAYLGSDGLYHFVVSPTDPGVANWIDTQGRTDGFVFLRWQHITGPFTAADSPTGKLVPITEVSSVLPPGTPSVTSAEEVQALRARDAGVARRVLLASDPAAPVLTNDLGLIEAHVGAQALHAIYPANVP
jgi:hypothetical protein